MKTHNDNDELIASRCMHFVEMLLELAPRDAIPRDVLESVVRLIEAKQTANKPLFSDLGALNDALIGTAKGAGYLAHYKAHTLDYVASVLAIMETAIELAASDDGDMVQ